MDPKLVYWTLAFANLGVIAACLWVAVRRVRRRDVRGHRRMMLTASALVGLFLLSYVLKVILLGREDLARWTPLERALLYGHELCVATALVSGCAAGICAWRFRRRLAGDAQRSLRTRRAHRRAGRAAVVSCLLSLATAACILITMYARACA
ncbi:MAG TPA: DUF420 domain-containing protein [Myxococcota bacterium]